MESQPQQALQYLEKDLADWEQAAEFFEKYNVEVIKWGAERLPQTQTAKEMSEMYRKRIAERKELIEKLKKEHIAA